MATVATKEQIRGQGHTTLETINQPASITGTGTAAEAAGRAVQFQGVRDLGVSTIIRMPQGTRVFHHQIRP